MLVLQGLVPAGCVVVYTMKLCHGGLDSLEVLAVIVFRNHGRAVSAMMAVRIPVCVVLQASRKLVQNRLLSQEDVQPTLLRSGFSTW